MSQLSKMRAAHDTGMTGALAPCGVSHLVVRGPPLPELVLTCQRPAGHQGQHCAIWPNAFIEWDD